MSVDRKRKYGIYVHIPFCRAKCDYCAFVSSSDLSTESRYVKVLIDEIAGCDNVGASVDTVYIGGGTPSCLSRGALSDIFQALRGSFKIDRDAEITVECNPESVDIDFVNECVDCGANRISMGLQSSSDSVLRGIGRVHSYADYLRAVRLLASSFDNISSDLILGLPDQDMSDIRIAVDAFAEYCKHVSVYALTVENGTPLCARGYEPDDDSIADMYDCARRLLAERGFERYEVSNFALSGKESRHNNKYWNCEAYMGFGVAAHGYDGENIRYRHTDDVGDYLKCPITEKIELSFKDKYNEYVMLRLRTERGININDFGRRFGFDFIDRNADIIKKLSESGYILRNKSNIRISPQYFFVMNGLIEQFMLD